MVYNVLKHLQITFASGQSYQKALTADPSYKPAAECLAIVLTDLGTSLKLAGNTQEGIQKYFEALKIDPHYAVISYFAFILLRCLSLSLSLSISQLYFDLCTYFVKV